MYYSNQNLLSSTRTVLQHLINRPVYQTVDSLYYDFFAYTGCNIPFYELGYSYLTKFLESIPDIIKVDPNTLQVRAVNAISYSFKQKRQSYAPYETTAQFCYIEQPSPILLYQPHVLPPAFPRKNKSRSITIKMGSTSLTKGDDDTYLFPLGPRSYGDGKYSSTDSIRSDKPLALPHDNTDLIRNDKQLELPQDTLPTTNEENAERTAYFDVQTNDSKRFSRTCENFFDSPRNDDIAFDASPNVQANESSQGEELEFVYNLETDEEEDISGVSEKSLNLRSFSESPPPPYSEGDDKAADNKGDTIVELDKESHMCCNYETCYYLSTPEEKLSQSSTVSAIPFMFTEEDYLLDLVDSAFYKGRFGAKFKTTPIDDVVKVGSFYEVYVSEVSSPFKFWFQLIEEDSNGVDEIQESLQLSYERHSEDIIKSKHMKKGYACAALYDKVWHRGEIQAEPIDGFVKIFFVDFGTTTDVDIKDVRYLLKSFCYTPKLCHRGTLDFVKPLSYRWGVEASYCFINLIQNRKLVAGITEIYQETNSARLYLLDREANVVNINYELVIQGCAFAFDPRERYEPHISEVQPTFECLEKGDYPPLEEDFDIERELQSSIIEGFDYVIPHDVSDEEAVELVEAINKRKEEAKEAAKKRDGSVFMFFFGSIMNNPFFNGTMTEIVENAATNPFLDG